MFKNPILGVLVGAILTAIIQSSSASVGILQSLCMTGAASYGAAIPIIMGQNIGTCITAILSSFGTNRNAKRAAIVHLSFNVIGTAVCLSIFAIVKAVFAPALFDQSATQAGIAVAHSAFNIFCTLLLLPASALLEKLAYRLVPDAKTPEKFAELDERLLATPTIALERCHALAVDMAEGAFKALDDSLTCLTDHSDELAKSIREAEEKTDHYEDVIGSYLVKLSSNQISDKDSTEAASLLKIIGDIERISDHSVNLLESAEEMKVKGIIFSDSTNSELKNIISALHETVALTDKSFVGGDLTAAKTVEPLEQIIDKLKVLIRNNHIIRLQQGNCSIETGFVWLDILTNIERTSDHCSNIAGCVIDAKDNNLNLHESLRQMKSDSPYFKEQYAVFAEKYL